MSKALNPQYIYNWMCQNVLELNKDKTEVIGFVPKNE